MDAIDPPSNYMSTPPRKVWDAGTWEDHSKPEVTYDECMDGNADKATEGMESLMRQLVSLKYFRQTFQSLLG